MPIISRFLGIMISMYWNDHSPPHFHAKYGEYEITVQERLKGDFRREHYIMYWNGMTCIRTN